MEDGRDGRGMKRYDEDGRERWRGEVGMWENRRETEKDEKDTDGKQTGNRRETDEKDEKDEKDTVGKQIRMRRMKKMKV